MSKLRYDNQVFVITGAEGGIGKEYATFFASRGASVVVNDLGASWNGTRSSDTLTADAVVHEIKAAGGKAVANYDSVESGEKIIHTAIENFGRIDVLINNAGIVRDISFENMTDTDWDRIMAINLRGAYKCTRAAWPHFRKQRFGRVINTSSTSGLFGNFGQTMYAAAKLALVGLTQTLALEGIKYNILANALAPAAATRITETVMAPNRLAALNPEWLVPIVAVLVHSSNTTETGSIFQVGAAHISKIRWERSEGAFLKPDDSLTPGVILNNWNTILDFSRNPQYPNRASHSINNLKKALALPRNPNADEPDFRSKVALITGAGTGLGRAYALAFAEVGAKVVVNDVKDADMVTREIRSTGGDAVEVNLSVEDGNGIIRACIKAYGRIDIIVNNAGILRDKSFSNMTDELWEPVINVHLRGTYKITKAAWPHMVRQRYGRIVNVTSSTGIYGKFGQANYAAAKAGILGFSRSLAREGAKHNINVNIIGPSAGTAMARTVRPEKEVQALKPAYVAPFVLALCSDKVPTPPGGLYELGAGWFGATRWQRAGGYGFPSDKRLTPEDVLKVFDEIIDFENGRADNPSSYIDGPKSIMGNMENILTGNEKKGYHEKIAAAQKMVGVPAELKYDNREVIFYNLGIGARRTDLRFVFEGDPQFQALPTFGVIPAYAAQTPYNLEDILPNFDPRMLLAGEHYLEILRYPIPTKATLVSTTHLVEVLDKGKDAVVRRGNITVDAATGKPVFYNENASFIRGCGGFGGPKKPSDRGAVTAANIAPSRNPDYVQEEKTSKEIAALYRLSGDRNPLHIDPTFSAKGGFKAPILHGLATMGISGKHIYTKFGPFKSIKARFAGTVLPGDTLVTEMWKEGRNRIVYQVRVKESGKLAITNAAVELMVQDEKANL